MRFETAYEVSSSKNRRLRKERKKTLREVTAAICVPLTTYRDSWGATVPGDQRCLGTAYACSNTMFHSNLTRSRDSIALQMVNSGSWCRADIVDISRSFSLSASPGKYICVTRR